MHHRWSREARVLSEIWAKTKVLSPMHKYIIWLLVGRRRKELSSWSPGTFTRFVVRRYWSSMKLWLLSCITWSDQPARSPAVHKDANNILLIVPLIRSQVQCQRCGLIMFLQCCKYSPGNRLLTKHVTGMITPPAVILLSGASERSRGRF